MIFLVSTDLARSKEKLKCNIFEKICGNILYSVS